MAALRKNPYLQYRVGLSRDCAIKRSIVRVHRRKCAKAETSDDDRAHHHRRIPHLVSELKVKSQAKRQRSVWAGRIWGHHSDQVHAGEREAVLSERTTVRRVAERCNGKEDSDVSGIQRLLDKLQRCAVFVVCAIVGRHSLQVDAEREVPSKEDLRLCWTVQRNSLECEKKCECVFGTSATNRVRAE